jgi:hypothetical protein
LLFELEVRVEVENFFTHGGDHLDLFDEKLIEVVDVDFNVGATFVYFSD